MSLARALAALAALALLAGSPELAAQPRPPKGGAEATFQSAQKKYDKKDYAGALSLFQEALASTGSPNAELYVARCLRELGKLTEAYAAMRHTARTATEKAASEPRYIDTRDAALAELSQLEAKVGRIVVSVAVADGAEVSINGTKIAPDDYDEPIGVAPGKATVTATAPGKPDFNREVQVAAGASEQVEVTFGAAPAPVAPAAPGDGDGPTTGGTVRLAGFAVAGLGVVGMAVFAITGSMAKSKFDTIEEECGHKRCTDPKYSDEISSGKTLTTLANISLVTGIVALAAGGAMIALGGPRPAPAETGLALGVSAGGGMATWRGKF